MNLREKYTWLLGCTALLLFTACKKWDDHVLVANQNLNETLTQTIAKRTELSKFNSYLVKTGLDTMLASSKNYTVFAPTDAALASLDPAVIADNSKLKSYLLNHISGQLFFTRMGNDSFRLQVINGKRIFVTTTKFDSANITTPDIYVKNGSLNIIDKGIAPLQNIWDYIISTRGIYQQNDYIASQNYRIQDPAQATLDSINPATGLPIYKPNTGIVTQNTFRTKVYDVANEDSLYTYIVLINTAYASEVGKQVPYFLSSIDSIAKSNSAWNVVKDLAIKGLYQPSQLTGALLSKFNVHVPISTAAVVESRKVSNGIVYVVNAAAAPMSEKIPVVMVQGENPYGFSFSDGTTLAKVFYRQRFNTLTNLSFKDIYLNSGSSGANRFIEYTSNGIFTGKYKVYWVALNDKVISGQGDDPYGTDSTLSQILQIGNTTDSLYTPTFNITTPIKPNTYTETYIGDYTNNTYNWKLSSPLVDSTSKLIGNTPATRKLRIQAPATQTSTIPYNLTLDYIKFVPQF